MADIQKICRLLTIAALMMITACTGYVTVSKQASGVYHHVRKGETLHRIAQLYQVSLQRIAEANNLDNVEIIEAGRVLFIPDAQPVAEDVFLTATGQEADKNMAGTPGGRQDLPARKGEKPALSPGSDVSGVKPPPREKSAAARDKFERSGAAKPEITAKQDKTVFPLRLPPTAPVTGEGNKGEGPQPDGEQAKIQREKRLFLWPVSGRVVTRYGIQPNGMFFNGIKIAAAAGASVVAAADGAVIFSAPLKDYGETIILKHDDDFASVYTQLGQRLVKRDDQVKKGDKIATLARSGMKGEALMNFEIRNKNIARNPLFFLP